MKLVILSNSFSSVLLIKKVQTQKQAVEKSFSTA
ncbi:hypothetical protein BCE_1952 [Bacillus cereus ATCC 10987]|uniref:Uncharacterized protein n=1 Tax=Bacillus cereus (strain ATCC 10987 / NRS 248) TaxID=222523 RepID=Q73A34_BACC1|nr:hypothetical protein BCE_1952 [Bacillus cereus ATCC 10987]